MSSCPGSAVSRSCFAVSRKLVGRAVLPTSYGVMLRNRPGGHTSTVSVLDARDGAFPARIVRERLGSDNFLDIGANQGVFSLVASKTLRESGHA
jgi:hypothetical protein